jgi:hypothetical protein
MQKRGYCKEFPGTAALYKTVSKKEGKEEKALLKALL